MTEVGIVRGDTPSDLGLSLAAMRHPDLRTRMLDLDQSPDESIAGLVVDVPPRYRFEALSRLARAWQVPILVEAPAAADVQDLVDLADAAGDRIASANPLRYGLHTRRLVEELQASGDPLETFFATLRFRPTQLPAHALPGLLDYLADVSHGEIERVASMAYPDPTIQIVSLRYASGVLGSLELGAHLPASFPSASELIVECFCRSHVFHCAPANQAVTVYDAISQRHIDWQPEPADAIVKAFATWLGGGPRPPGDIRRDLSAMTLAGAIAESARSDRVLAPAPVPRRGSGA
jgi:predicted dehydrogenase